MTLRNPRTRPVASRPRSLPSAWSLSSSSCPSSSCSSASSSASSSPKFYSAATLPASLFRGTKRQRRILKRFLNLNMLWNGTLYRRLERWERSWTLHTNPLHDWDDPDAGKMIKGQPHMGDYKKKDCCTKYNSLDDVHVYRIYMSRIWPLCGFWYHFPHLRH